MKAYFAASIAGIAAAAEFDMELNMKFMQHVSTYNRSYLTTEEFEARKSLFATVDA